MIDEKAKKALSKMSHDDLIRFVEWLWELCSRQHLGIDKLNKEIERLNNELIINESKKL